MASIDAPTRLPRATSLGILAGITNMTRMNRLTRTARITRLPILWGGIGKNGKIGRARAKW